MMSDNNVHDDSILVDSVIKENENLNLDSYFEISRFVTRGTLNAVGEERLGEENTESCDKKNLLLDDQKTKEIAGLRRELELISKLLSGYMNRETNETLESKQIAEQLNRGSRGSTSSIWDENGKHKECLRHLSHKGLINYFKNEMLQMKREHEYTIQEITEEYFSINRRCSNLEKRGFISCLNKDKEFGVLRKKIPDFISKLDKVLLEDEKPVFQGKNNVDLKNQVDSSLLENRRLKERLIDLEDSCAEERVGYEMEISELREKLELARENVKMTENKKVKCEMRLVSTKVELKRVKNQFVSTVQSLAKWSQRFNNLECVIAEKMKRKSSRLESMQSQLSGLLDEVDEYKARETMYKKQTEKKTCDLHKAETEVDLLGDEIESLLDLLAKIYVAIDHYSVIFKHYPGIIEIMKLVRRELKGESNRVFRASFI